MYRTFASLKTNYKVLLAIDIGNSRIKYAIFKENILLELRNTESVVLHTEVEQIISDYPEISKCIVSSVGKQVETDFLSIPESIQIHFVSHRSIFPFINQYQTPETLGTDRMILASGATMCFPEQNKLIIDVGTAITYDFIDKNNVYLGGAISPGISLRYKALHTYTAKLPLLEKQENDFFIEQTTSNSIHSGVINGVVFEIDSFVERLAHKYDNSIAVLTGGDTDFLVKKLKNTIFAKPNFLLESLNDLYQYQKTNAK